MPDDYIVVSDTDIETTPRSINSLLDQIRHVWKGKNLITRVSRLLSVDPSVACQKLFNAGIFDLREKIVTVGSDIAKEVAIIYKLPPIEKDEDILENYSTKNIIDLSYRLGILNRPEWRRIQRCYEIRKDLEHEDNVYEAVLEDCFYIFKSTIEIILSKDPIEILKVTDIKQIVEEPKRCTVSEELLDDYSRAPNLRQSELIKFLISTAKSDEHPDIVRENSFEILRHFKTLTKTPVIIKIAKYLEKDLGRSDIDLVTAKIGNAIGATAYFKKAKLSDYYNNILLLFKDAGSDWKKQSKAVLLFHDIGHFRYCPVKLINVFLKYVVLWYIGEPGGYGLGANIAVFYSNGAAPIILRIIESSDINLYDKIEKLRDGRNIKSKLSNKYILSRFEYLLDQASDIKSDL